MQIAVLVRREPAEAGAVAVDRIQVADPAVVAGEDQPLSVRAPGRRGDAAQLELNAPDLLVARHVHDDDVVAGAALRGKGQVFPVG